MHIHKVYISLTVVVMFIFASFSAVSSLNYEINELRHTIIVAVSSLPNGSYVGVSADLYVRVTCPGNGHVYVETLPLSQIDLQASTRIAALVASSIANVSFNECDYYASIKASAPIIGGPSASSVTAVAFAAALLRLPLNESVMMTGMIMPDGSIGPVGGLKYKLEAAASKGAKVLLIPYGQNIDYVYQVLEERWGPAVVRRVVRIPIDLIEYGKSLGVEVIPVATVYEALEIFTNKAYRVKYNFELINKRIDQIYEVVKPMLKQWISDLRSEVGDVFKVCSEMKVDVLSIVRQRYGSVIYRQVSSKVEELESSIRTLLIKASETENTGKLYSAASIYFQALIYAYTEYYLLNALKDPNSVYTRVEELKSEAYNLINNIHSCYRDQIDMLRLTIVINVLDRIYEALLYLNKISNLNDILLIASTIAYANARLRTANQWYNLMTISMNSNITASLEDVKSMAMYIDMLVQNIYAYLISLSESTSTQLPSEFEDAEQRYNLMQNTTEYLDKLALGISSISYMYQALVKLFTQSPEALTHTLNKTLYTNLGSIINNLPIDVVLYLEFIKSLIEDIGDLSSGAIALAKLSMMIALYKAMTTASAVNTTPRFITINSPTTSITYIPTSTVTVTSTITEIITYTSTSILTVYREDTTMYTYMILAIFGISILIMLTTIILISRKLM